VQSDNWQFWIDRGGTFTDVIGISASGELQVSKLLSENSQHYSDAAIAGIRKILGLTPEQAIDQQQISAVKMGTTVATNALLEHQGAKVLLLITEGLADLLSIGYQNRPDIFALDIKKPMPLYSSVSEIDERVSADGTVLKPLNEQGLTQQLQQALEQGFEAVAIALIHSYENPQHEIRLEQICIDAGFQHVSTSHKLSPLPRLVPRGDTCLVDAYLTPILKSYIDRVENALSGTPLQFMQSNGGLTDARKFSGCNSIVSGPAGGVVGMVETARQLGFSKIIGFDMGGTSTDICLYQGKYQQTLDSEIAGVRIRAPMLEIHTVAAGGGSCLSYKDQRFQVGPESAGASPGPACYGSGGPLSVTDIQVLLGRIRPDCFPAVFSDSADKPLNKAVVETAFEQLSHIISKDTGKSWSVEQVADGFMQIAIANMANAIKHMTTAKGLDAEDFIINCFGGAGGQHACKVAEQLNVKQILIHPMASLLSAYGMGQADTVVILQHSISATLSAQLLSDIAPDIAQLEAKAKAKMAEQNIDNPELQLQLSLRYKGSDNCLELAMDELSQLTDNFHQQHHEFFGFAENHKTIILDNISIEARHKPVPPALPDWQSDGSQPAQHPVYLAKGYENIKFYPWQGFDVGDIEPGPLVIYSHYTTIVVETGWQAEMKQGGTLLLSRVEQNVALTSELTSAQSLSLDPVRLELFSNLYRAIAEQMGHVLARTAHSVNIKERLDFSCAIFDAAGNLIANAPHMPVHLGSMGESITAVLNNVTEMLPGDVYLINDPYHGGTHLPDMTVVTPVFDQGQLIYLLASRGHHADIGGIAPGSMPSNSVTIDEEGCLFNCFKLVSAGVFQEQALLQILTSEADPTKNPARNPEQNIADLKAQIAANNKGMQEMQKAFAQHGQATVLGYMQYVQDNAEQMVRRVISKLHDGQYCYVMDNGAEIQVSVTINREDSSALIDFTGTSAQMENNFNAPSAISRAAVLYVFRCLIDEDIPLNAGCLRPLEIKIPEHSLLNPSPPAAVVAGNVETSQCITDALFCALGVVAGSQGTMNNVTFGDEQFQYYETIAGGAGATENCAGASGVQTHMTNSRITDPEILERRFPVLLSHYGYRQSTGGHGANKGGDGLHREIKFLQPMAVNLLTGNRQQQPPGIKGGSPGSSGQNQWLKQTGECVELTGTCTLNVNSGDKLIIKTPGGGGFGHSVE